MENLKTERLKISGISNNSPEETQSIFKDIASKTGVKIQWENNKVPTSTIRRDSVIRMCGTQEAIKTAREMILQNLESESNRIILKMDVTHEEHPSLIGKKGFLIKQVMDSTNCHIHFPDTNKIPSNEKSNQVSITGDPSNVEKARIMIRSLLPFQVIYEVKRTKFPPVNTSSPFWKSLESKLGLAIHFIEYKDFISVIIRCSQRHFRDLRLRILAVIEFLSGERGSNLPTSKVILDIMPAHQNFVKGPKGANVQAIAKNTGARIQFPDIKSDVSNPRAVKIEGSLDCVYMAWQEIMSSLPICVLFDVRESRDTKSECEDFLTYCNITVNSKPNPKYYTKGITVKGPEKVSKLILQYRQQVLSLPSIRFSPEADVINTALKFQNSPSDIHNTSLLENLPMISSIMLSNAQLESLTNVLNATSGLPYKENNFSNAPVSYSTLYPSVTCMNAVYGCKSSYEGIEGEGTYSNMKPVASVTPMYNIPSSPLAQCADHAGFIFGKWEENVNNSNSEGERTYCNMKPVASVMPMYHIPSSPLTQYAGHVVFGRWEENNNNTEATRKETHVVRDNPVSSCKSNSHLSEDQIKSAGSPSFRRKSMDHYDIFEKRLSAFQATRKETHVVRDNPVSSCKSNSHLSEDQIKSAGSPSLRKKSMDHYEIFEKRLSAFQAIHRNIESTQVPSSLWAGYGFSQSMPAAIVPRDSNSSSLYSSTSLEAVADPESSSSCSSEETWDIVLADYIDDKIWSNKDENIFSMSNVFDFKRHTTLPVNPGSEDILPRLLYEVGLYSLLDIFLKEEIDYCAFLLLNDDDLISLGISYPARMKITCLIRELQDAEMKMQKTFDAAPGAGRKIIEF